MKNIFLLLLILFIFTGCDKTSEISNDTFKSFRDLPGITADEIKRIEDLKYQIDYFVYGMPFTSEAFYNNDGEIQGFAALFCEWLTDLFEIPFKPAIYEWGDMLDGLESGDVDFTGEMRATEDRLMSYYMTDAIAERTLSYFRLADSKPLEEIEADRLLRYAFLKGATTAGTITSMLKPGTYEVILIDSVHDVHDMLRSGEIDAFFYSNVAEAAFYQYEDMVAKTFFPLIYSPVSLTTQNADYKVIVTVVQKVLRNNGLRYLTSLYNRGQRDYMMYKLNMLLTEEELAYIHDNPVIRYAAEYNNYPISFYNVHEKQFQGIAIDLLREVELFTGITFETANATNRNVEFPTLLNMLEDGEVSFITELIRSDDREDKFLWPKAVNMTDYIALVSKSDLENVKLNEILYMKVGFGKNTAYAELFNRWFPNHRSTVEYESTSLALDALGRGEVDMVMASLHQLLIMTHYQELPGYKANFIFDSTFDSKFGFNKDQTILCSIFDKALSLTNTTAITEMWTRQTYDYRLKLAQAQLPWFIGASVLSICILILVFILFNKTHRTGRQFESLVAKRTQELEQEIIRRKSTEEEARSASQAKSAFLANMSHELRTPLNVVLGLTYLTLDANHLPKQVSDNLQKINNAGSILLSLVNDLLDISKIESGNLVITPVEYHLASLLNDIITLVNIRLEEKMVTFRLNINDDLPAKLYGDDLRVKQIFNNLLSNALKYTNEGMIELSVRCIYENDKDVWMEITVSDTGIGIHEDDLKKIFSEYNQVDMQAKRKMDGTGLGLAITKRLTEMLDGEISAESEYGKGTTFRVRIRQGFVSDVRIGTVTAESLRNFRYTEEKSGAIKKLARPDLSFAKVLIVDDMQTNLDLTAGLLCKYKMQVDCVTSGNAAIERIRSGEPVYNAVFMDHMMPEMDGIEAAEAIRGLNTYYARNVPIIVLTANAIDGTESLFYEHGFQAYLTKPIDIMQLDSVIRKWVRGQTPDELIQDVKTQDVISHLGLSQEDAAVAKEEILPCNIPGVDTERGLSYWGDDMPLYLSILRSFVDNTPETLEKLRNVSEKKLLEYRVSVHGLKGTSASIGADNISKIAEHMEAMAKAGNLLRIQEVNEDFIRDTEEVLHSIKTWLAKRDGNYRKPFKTSPNWDVLLKLLQSCENYDIRGIDKAMDALEVYDYEEGADLIKWLRMKIDLSEFSDAAARIKVYGEEFKK